MIAHFHFSHYSQTTVSKSLYTRVTISTGHHSRVTIFQSHYSQVKISKKSLFTGHDIAKSLFAIETVSAAVRTERRRDANWTEELNVHYYVNLIAYNSL